MQKTPLIKFSMKRIKVLCPIITFVLITAAVSISSSKIPAFPISEEGIRLLLSNCIYYEDSDFFSPCSPLASFNNAPARAQDESGDYIRDAQTPQNKSDAPVKPVTAQNLQKDIKLEFTNNTSETIDASLLVSNPPQFLNSDFSVLIVHTHTTESYTPSEKYNYTPTDTDRTLDEKYNVTAVGAKIAEVLKEGGINVVHDTTVNDYPSYNGSYNKCAAIVKKHIANDPSIKVVLDIHRDAIETKNGKKIAHTTVIDSKKAAKIMFVVGSDLSGLSHDHWRENLAFASMLQNHINTLYPDLCRPINFRSQRFNQQLAPGAIIVEIGTNGNTLDEALVGAQYFAEALISFKNSLADYQS